MSIEHELFTTYNIFLSSVFISEGAKLEKIERNDAGKALFCFVYSDDLLTLNDKFWKKELLCEPQSLFDSLKFLKSRIYSQF